MRPELEDTLKHYGVKGMKWDESKKKVQKNFDELLDAARERASKVGKKLSKIDDVLKKYGNKTLISIFGPAGKPKTTFETISVTRNGKWVDTKKHKPAKGSNEWYNERLKKETPAQTRKRLKKEWKNVPDAKLWDQ